MFAILSNPINTVWLVLLAGTALSWFLVPEDNNLTSLIPGIAILSIAFFKVRLILLYFMDLRFAPQPWRGIFESWILVAWAAIVYLYIIGTELK